MLIRASETLALGPSYSQSWGRRYEAGGDPAGCYSAPSNTFTDFAVSFAELQKKYAQLEDIAGAPSSVPSISRS